MSSGVSKRSFSQVEASSSTLCRNEHSLPFPCRRVTQDSAVKSAEASKGCSGGIPLDLDRWQQHGSAFACPCVHCCPCSKHANLQAAADAFLAELSLPLPPSSSDSTPTTNSNSNSNNSSNKRRKGRQDSATGEAAPTMATTATAIAALDMFNSGTAQPVARERDVVHTRWDLQERFDVKEKIGSGTFSTVYRALVKPDHPLNANLSAYKEVAIKRFLTHSHADRLQTEEEFLWRFGDRSRHILPLLGSHHMLGAPPALVLPYCRHQEFRHHYKQMSLHCIQRYMYGLLVALQRLHEYGIIHRDVKPDNYLFDFEAEKSREKFLASSMKKNSIRNEKEIVEELNGFLIDFGLAHTELQLRVELQKDHRLPSSLRSEQEMQQLAAEEAESELRSDTSADKPETANTNSTTHADSTSAPSPTLSATVAPSITAVAAAPPAAPRRSPRKTGLGKSHAQLQAELALQASLQAAPKRVLPSRPIAPRSGTRGYRAPEILAYSQQQTVALDIWAAGTILLSLVTHKYPFFSCPDDSTGLAEIMHLFQLSQLQAGGQLVTFERNEAPRCDLNLYCQHSSGVAWPSELMELLRGLLHVDPAQRLTATQALQHPFMTRSWVLEPRVKSSHQLCCHAPQNDTAHDASGVTSTAATASTAAAAHLQSNKSAMVTHKPSLAGKILVSVPGKSGNSNRK